MATGIAGIIGNKGAVSLALRFGQKSLLFTTAHLSPHQGKVGQRNYDFHKIDRGLGMVRIGKLRRRTRGQTLDVGSQRESVHARFDYAFFFGDLNFRVDHSRSRADLLLRHGDYNELLSRDQLRREMKKNALYHGWREAEIHFPPTYKFDILRKSASGPGSTSRAGGTGAADVYDTSSKSRIPSWTDRIIYRTRDRKPSRGSWNRDRIRVLRYDGIMDMYGSDHRPVVGVYELAFDWEAQREGMERAGRWSEANILEGRPPQASMAYHTTGPGGPTAGATIGETVAPSNGSTMTTSDSASPLDSGHGTNPTSPSASSSISRATTPTPSPSPPPVPPKDAT